MYKSDPTYPLFPVFSFFSFILVLVPLPWHFQAWNAGTCLYMVWAALACLNQFVNSVVWHDNALNPAPVWCDISTRILIGSSVAIPAASLCINRRLYKIASGQYVRVSRGQKRRAVIEDLAIGLGTPLIEIALAYIVTGHRFDIYEDIGCYPAIYNVWLTYVLTLSWPIVIGLISGVYCVMSLRAFWKRQAQFSQMLSNSTSLTPSRYFRLMALATTELFCTTPIASYFMYVNLTSVPLNPYKGWDDLHFNFSNVGQFSSVLWRSNRDLVITLEMTRWLPVVCGVVFFTFFGFAEEARKYYGTRFWAIAKRLHLAPTVISPEFTRFKISTRAAHGASSDILPVFVSRPVRTGSQESLATATSQGEKETYTSSLESPSIADKEVQYAVSFDQA